MAIIKYSKIENNNIFFSGLLNDNDYVNDHSYEDVQNPITLFSFTGKNYSKFISQIEPEQIIDFLVFKNGEKIVIKCGNSYVNQYGNSKFYYRSVVLLFYYIDSNGIENHFKTIQVETEHGTSTDNLEGLVYFSAAIDDINKQGYLNLISSGITYGTGSGDSRKIGTKIFEVSNLDTRSIFYNLFINGGVVFDPDPWSNAGYSGIGGGDGTFNFESDTIALPSLPAVDAVSSGFLQLFSGGLSSILELSKYMWSTSFFDSVVKITSNPIDIIMGLYMYPLIVPASNQKYIRAGNVITNVVMNVPDSQIIEIDCGSVEVPNFYGAYLDYEPFTKCDLFLPYCGTFPLSMDDIAGKTLTIKYRVDLLTGVCGAYVVIDESVKYNYTGTCAINIPISSRSFENVYNSIMGVVGSMIGGSSFGLPSVGSVAGAVTSGKNQIQHGGNCSGNAGYLGVQKPYLIFSVPNVAIPKGLNTYTGYPIFATYKLAELKGYTEVEEIHLENLGSATKEEIDMIINKLKEGVIL